MSNLYDIIIIGGGIHGVGVAQAAAAAGYKTALLEKEALAVGTSSRSSKLIHGGLRYLESGRLRMVYELLRERELLLKNAPDLVHLEPFYIPIYRHTIRRPWQIRVGLSLYSLLGGLSRHVRYHSIPRRQWHTLDGLTLDGLQAVLHYSDAQTDDAQLTRAVMHSAQELGAELLCPADFIGANIEKKMLAIDIKQDTKTTTLQCRVLVNAAGPWVNEVLGRISPSIRPLRIDLVQGSHIIIGAPKVQGLYYVESRQDRRAVFVMPWCENVMVGTTEVLFTGPPDDVQPGQEEISYLRQVVHDYFPGMNDKIIGKFAGLRVLPGGSGKFFRRSREVVLYNPGQAPNLLTIYGGKLTNYRSTAGKVLKLLKHYMPGRKKIANTAALPIKPVEREVNNA